MSAERLDAQLQPLAQFLLLIIVLLVVAAISSYVLSKLAARRREQAHNKLSASRRGKHTSIDLFAKPQSRPESQRHKRRSRSGSSTHHIDILKRPAGPADAGEGEASEKD